MKSIPARATLLAVAFVVSSCSLITFDCNGPTTREVIAGATPHADGDTTSVRGRLELPSGVVVYRAAMRDNLSEHNLGTVLAAVQLYDLAPPVFDEIRRHLLANDLLFVFETDSTIRFAPERMSVQSSHDWRKSSACP